MKFSVSFTTLLFVVFLVLKLCGIIAWSWWWVFSPFWIPVLLGFIIFIGLGSLLGIAVFKKI